jgi:hypothetical protein
MYFLLAKEEAGWYAPSTYGRTMKFYLRKAGETLAAWTSWGCPGAVGAF